MTLQPWQWLVAVLAAMLVGLSKTGVAGIGLLVVVLFAQIVPAKEASGIVLPLLICGDLVAVASYRLHARWAHVVRLLPWTALGVVLGSMALGRIDDRQARLLIGGIVIGLIALHVVRRRTAATGPATAAGAAPSHAWWFAPAVGVLAGFTTLVANAAGPLMIIYLLAMGLPKMEFVGTNAVFFLVLNLFKVPFMIHLGLINDSSLPLNLKLVPAVLAGAWLGRKLLARLKQRMFENLALGLSALAGLKLFF